MRICEPGELEVLKTRLGVADVKCAMFLKTSNAPQRDLQFKLDDKFYVARIRIIGAEPPLQLLK